MDPSCLYQGPGGKHQPLFFSAHALAGGSVNISEWDPLSDAGQGTCMERGESHRAAYSVSGRAFGVPRGEWSLWRWYLPGRGLLTDLDHF